eukprot:1822971-Amphidinium_carterae.1
MPLLRFYAHCLAKPRRFLGPLLEECRELAAEAKGKLTELKAASSAVFTLELVRTHTHTHSQDAFAANKSLATLMHTMGVSQAKRVCCHVSSLPPFPAAWPVPTAAGLKHTRLSSR